jgi:light-regulated signal transduction histidine kinase (bacteriophytochrome)
LKTKESSLNARGLSLRSILTATTIVGASLALLGAGSLIAMTTILHRTTVDAAVSVETIRLAQEAEIELLLHGRTTNALLMRDIEERIKQSLADARKLVTSEHERRTIAEAESQVAAYFVAAQDREDRTSDLAARAHGWRFPRHRQDHGAGIPEAEHQGIFEPFRRVGLEKQAVPGVGLGLFVVRRIVEAHSGRIDVESPPGAGTTFRVYIPRPPRARDDVAASPDEPRSLIH